MGLSHDASLSSAGSQRAQFPGCQRYYEGATTSQPRINGRLFGSLPPPTGTSWGLCLAAALLEDRRSLPGQGSFAFAGDPCSGSPLNTWTRLGSLRSPGDPSRASAAFQDPGRTDVSLPLTATSMLPPLSGRRRLRRYRISGLTPAASAPALLRFALPLLSRARLASGWLASLCREGVEPSGPLWKVSARIHDLPPSLYS